mmetsp:Transcript_36792/g.64824  ORF Transcript_36792/g.64824 Transcript_36792/m.64824 type:complete len:225 (+) Transcript_36792:74-748(+)
MAGELNMTALSPNKNSPKWSFAGRYQAVDKKKGMPGPGQYGQVNTEKDKFTKSASFTLGAGMNHNKLWATWPGPGQYTVKQEQKTTPPRWGFGSEARLHELRKPQTPGPGQYEVRGKIGAESLQYGIQGKAQATTRSSTPGPGTYKPCWEPTQTSSPKYGQGSSTREKLKPSKDPGPGQYEAMKTLGGNGVMRCSPKYSFRGKPSPPTADSTPGPGTSSTQFTR